MKAWHWLLILLPALLGGCTGLEAAVIVDGASVAVFGRDVVDIGVSAVTGRDCSVVRLDRRQPYCAPREQLPGPPPFCSRTLADVTCWVNPEKFPIQPRQVVDAPAPTKEQAQQITARWPKSLNLLTPTRDFFRSKRIGRSL